MQSNLIVVTGLPGTGKSSLAKYLSNELQLPYFSKDMVKELLFDSLGWSDREWSKKIGEATYEILDYFVEEQFKAQRSVIIESNFKPAFDNEKFQNWQKRYHFNTIQVMCNAKGDVLFERFKKRALSGDRHPGHDDANNLDEFKRVLSTGKSEFLDLEGGKLDIDTTDFNAVDYATILKGVKELIK